MLETIAADWPAPENIVAFSTTRQGGVSEGVYASLNLGAHVGDSPEAVRQNRHILRNRMALPAEPVWLNQQHGTTIVEMPSHPIATPADGAITSVPGIVCAVMTADCLPLLLCSSDGKQVAAIHVGWRGLAAGIVEQAIAKFKLPANELLAWAGAAISIDNFEIGLEVKQALGGPEAAYRTAENPQKAYADLWQLTAARLEQCGVGYLAYARACTYADSTRFFSHRRDGISGRLASMIYIKEID